MELSTPSLLTSRNEKPVIKNKRPCYFLRKRNEAHVLRGIPNSFEIKQHHSKHLQWKLCSDGCFYYYYYYFVSSNLKKQNMAIFFPTHVSLLFGASKI